ncbi:MAG: galactose-1-phosphate uridylyltransferase [Anaerolineae bacterium]
MSEMRWDPLLEEWVVTASQRQERTFFPPPDYCPLCPTRPGGFPTEIPEADFQIVVFENKFPAFRRNAPPPEVASVDVLEAMPAEGECEVVVYTPKHEGTLTEQPVEAIDRLIWVWTDRTRELGARPEVQYVLVFENKGEEIGVTLNHPHGQIYGFPFIPPVPARELASHARHMERTGRCLMCDILAIEHSQAQRITVENDDFTALVPYYARYPYEVHVISRRHLQSLLDLTRQERWSLARVLKTVMEQYDALYGFSLGYMMVLHQAPTDGQAHLSYHFHIEFMPLRRTAEKLKFRASCESGAGTFVTDGLAEDWAARLRGDVRG